MEGGLNHQMVPSNKGLLNLKGLGAIEFQQKGIILLDLKFVFFLMYKSVFIYICIQILLSNLNLILCLYIFK